MTKSSRKKTKLQTPRGISSMPPDMGSAVLFFFVFSRFWQHWQPLPKSVKYLDKTKKTKNCRPHEASPQSLQTKGLQFFCFLEILAAFAQICKRLEKTKNHNKKNCRPHGPSPQSLQAWGLHLCFVFFSRLWQLLPKSAKKCAKYSLISVDALSLALMLKVTVTSFLYEEEYKFGLSFNFKVSFC